MKIKTIAATAPRLIGAYFGLKTPIRITHCITYRCNLDCQYCSRHEIDEPELTTAEVKVLMETFARGGTKFWSFNGGEPLMRDDLGELIRHGKRLGMTVTLATNGTLLMKRLKDLQGIDAVSVSIDGPKSLHDARRCHSHDRIIEGLVALRDERIKTILGAVVSCQALESIDYLLGLADTLGAQVIVQPIRRQSEDDLGKSESLFPVREEMREAFEELLQQKHQGRPIASSSGYLEAIRDSWPDGPPRGRCWAGRVFGFLTPDGRATACCDTLASTGHDPDCSAMLNGVKAFSNIRPPCCRTCFSSVPLETNMMMNSFLLRRPKL